MKKLAKIALYACANIVGVFTIGCMVKAALVIGGAVCGK